MFKNVAITASIFAVLASGLGWDALAQGASAKENPLGAPDGGVRALIEQAHRLNGAGRHAEAEAIDRLALDRQLDRTGADDPELGNILMDLAMEVSSQGRFDEAKGLFDQAAPLVKRSPDPFVEPRFVSYLAIDAINRGNFAEARDFARQASVVRQSLADALRRPNAKGLSAPASRGPFSAQLAEGELAHSLMIEAQASYQLGDLAAAESAGSQALTIVERAPRLPAGWKPKVMTVLGEIETRSGHLARAEALLKTAAAESRDLFGDSLPTALALFALGRFYAVSGDYSAAREVYLQGLAMMNLPQQAANRLPFDRFAEFFLSSLAEAGRQTANREQVLDPVFLALQRVQTFGGYGMAVRVAEADPQVSHAVQDLALADRLAGEARLRLAEEVGRPADQQDLRRQRQLAEQYRGLAAQAADLRRDMSKNFPDYAQLVAPPMTTVSTIRSRLGDGDGFLSFAFGSSFGLVSLVTPTNLAIEKIDLSTSAVDDMVKQLRDCMVIRNGKVASYDHDLAHQLYERLFGRLQTDLSPVRHLHVVVSGSLSDFPFAALEIEMPEPGRARPVWMIDRFTLTSWPSAGAFQRLHGDRPGSHAARPFFGIGAPRLSAADARSDAGPPGICRDGRPFPRDILEGLPPLPDAAVELRRVAFLFHAAAEDVLIGDAATEGNLRNHPLTDYRVIYFATHGLLANELRCQPEPSLVLRPPASPAVSREQDGLLEGSEIARLKLDADLVVLSACNTAVNGLRTGAESLISLADTFFLAGARSVLASHWSVPSASTMALMSELFSRQVSRPIDGYAESLRQAQLILVDNPLTGHPVHWAGFTLIGEAGTISEQSKRD